MTPDALLLSVRADEALLRLGCRTLRDVCRLTANDLLALPNCGKKSVAEIRVALGKFGLCLHEPTKQPRARATIGADQQDVTCVQARSGVERSATPQPCRAGTSLPSERSECMLAQLPSGDGDGITVAPQSQMKRRPRALASLLDAEFFAALTAAEGDTAKVAVVYGVSRQAVDQACVRRGLTAAVGALRAQKKARRLEERRRDRQMRHDARRCSQIHVRADGVCEVTLSTGAVALVDARDADDVRQYRWSVTTNRYARSGRCSWEYMHRFVMRDALSSADAIKRPWIDHINGDPLDNRRANLRLASKEENANNRRYHPMTGVTRSGANWRADIQCGGKIRYLGSYDTPEEAAVAYRNAALELRGEFAATGIEGGPAPARRPLVMVARPARPNKKKMARDARHQRGLNALRAHPDGLTSVEFARVMWGSETRSRSNDRAGAAAGMLRALSRAGAVALVPGSPPRWRLAQCTAAIGSASSKVAPGRVRGAEGGR